MSLLPLQDPTFADNPEQYFKVLREEAPLYWSEDYGFWVVSCYEDVDRFSRNPQMFSSRVNFANSSKFAETDYLPMLQDDPPVHTRLRSLVSRTFSPRRIAKLEQGILDLSLDLVNDIERKYENGEKLDFFRDYSSPLPVNVIANLLGVPSEERENLQLWAEATGIGSGERYTPDQQTLVTDELRVCLERLIDLRRTRPEDDLISAMAKVADEDGEKLKADELLGFCELFWIAGNETTTNLLSNGAVFIQKNPEWKNWLSEADENEIGQFVEEMLRLNGPVNGLFRSATQNIHHRGVEIQEGQPVLLLWASANMDEKHFENPAIFNIERSPNDHLAFGKGIHFCAGAALARMEARIAFPAVAKLLGKYTLVPEEGLRIPSPVLRGWVSLPMR